VTRWPRPRPTVKAMAHSCFMLSLHGCLLAEPGAGHPPTKTLCLMGLLGRRGPGDRAGPYAKARASPRRPRGDPPGTAIQEPGVDREGAARARAALGDDGQERSDRPMIGRSGGGAGWSGVVPPALGLGSESLRVRSGRQGDRAVLGTARSIGGEGVARWPGTGTSQRRECGRPLVPTRPGRPARPSPAPRTPKAKRPAGRG